jgi:hypothetical protein
VARDVVAAAISGAPNMVHAAAAEPHLGASVQVDAHAHELTMPIPPPKIKIAHGVLTVPVDEPVQRTPEVNRQLAAALHTEFPTTGDIELPDEAPDELPHLVLQGRSAQVAFSSIQADFEVRFFGELESSPTMCLDYVERKMLAIFHAWSAVGARPTWLGLVLTLHASTPDEDEPPGRLLLEKHLQPELADDSLHDVNLQLGLRVADHFFVTLGIGQYESRQITRQVAGGTTGVIRPWEGEVTDAGIAVTVDVNNRLRAQLQRQFTRADEDEIRALNALAWGLAEHVVPRLLDDGVLDLSSAQGVVA